MSLHFICKPRERRIKRLDIRTDILLDLLRGQDGTCLFCSQGIPEDARTVGITVDEIVGTVTIYVESKDFEPVSENCAPDALNVYFTNYWPEAMLPDQLLFTVGKDKVQEVLNRANAERQRICDNKFSAG